MNETPPEEVLSAFVDGESVDPDALLEALATEHAHATIVEIVRLRASLRTTEETPSATWTDDLARRLATHQPSPWRRRVSVPAPIAAAAAALLVVVVGALALRPGHVDEVTVTPRVEIAGAGAPPPAQRVLTFEPGRDWTEKETTP